VRHLERAPLIALHQTLRDAVVEELAAQHWRLPELLLPPELRPPVRVFGPAAR
jgi:hypothetical protein